MKVFEWLLQYINAKGEDLKPPMTNQLCISILVSADFLQMENLVREAGSHFLRNFNEIVKLPLDLKCINNRTLDIITGDLEYVPFIWSHLLTVTT